MDEAEDTIPPLPKVSNQQAAVWTDTPPPWERRNPVLYRENDVLQILDLLKDPARKAVLLEGKGGVGKSTTVVELASALEMQGTKFGFFSPKEFTPISFTSHPDVRLPMTAEFLEDYAKIRQEPALVLMDSGDYLFCTAFGVNKTYEALKAAQHTGGLSGKEVNVLQHYKNSDRLIDVLARPQFKVVTTWHSDWSLDNREPTLYSKWRRAIPEGSEYKLSPHVPVEKGVAYLKERNDLSIGSDDTVFAEAIATVLEFGELKDLKPTEYQELQRLMSRNDRNTWWSTINNWANSNLSRRKRK